MSLHRPSPLNNTQGVSKSSRMFPVSEQMFIMKALNDRNLMLTKWTKPRLTYMRNNTQVYGELFLYREQIDIKLDTSTRDSMAKRDIAIVLSSGDIHIVNQCAI